MAKRLHLSECTSNNVHNIEECNWQNEPQCNWIVKRCALQVLSAEELQKQGLIAAFPALYLFAACHIQPLKMFSFMKVVFKYDIPLIEN